MSSTLRPLLQQRGYKRSEHLQPRAQLGTAAFEHSISHTDFRLPVTIREVSETRRRPGAPSCSLGLRRTKRLGRGGHGGSSYEGCGRQDGGNTRWRNRCVSRLLDCAPMPLYIIFGYRWRHSSEGGAFWSRLFCPAEILIEGTTRCTCHAVYVVSSSLTANRHTGALFAGCVQASIVYLVYLSICCVLYTVCRVFCVYH